MPNLTDQQRTVFAILFAILLAATFTPETISHAAECLSIASIAFTVRRSDS